jgi:hypothetical protein
MFSAGQSESTPDCGQHLHQEPSHQMHNGVQQAYSQRMVVFPALSSPSTSMRASFSPK